jgi:hypothetical protein
VPTDGVAKSTLESQRRQRLDCGQAFLDLVQAPLGSDNLGVTKRRDVGGETSLLHQRRPAEGRGATRRDCLQRVAQSHVLDERPFCNSACKLFLVERSSVHRQHLDRVPTTQRTWGPVWSPHGFPHWRAIMKQPVSRFSTDESAGHGIDGSIALRNLLEDLSQGARMGPPELVRVALDQPVRTLCGGNFDHSVDPGREMKAPVRPYKLTVVGRRHDEHDLHAWLQGGILCHGRHTASVSRIPAQRG